MSNARFSEYVTSGAFNLSLSRNQVAALSMCVEGADLYGATHSYGALERKGLVEFVPNPTGMAFESAERHQVRPSNAGLLTLQLLAEAGMGNHANAVAEELVALRAQLAEARRTAADLRVRLTSAMARKDRAVRLVVAARKDNRRLMAAVEDLTRGGPVLTLKNAPDQFIITLKDPLPHLSDAELLAGVPEPQPRGAT